MLLMVLAVLAFSGMAVCVKLLGPGIPSHEKILVRSVATVPILLWMLRRRGLSVRGRAPGLLFLRGLSGFIGMQAYFVSLAYLPMGNAVLLTHASPLASAWLASRFLGERAGRAVWVASVTCLLGVALVARPTQHVPLLFAAIALGSALINGASYTLVRAVAQKDHPLVVVLWLPLVCLPATAVMSALDWVPPDARQWGWLVGLTVTSLVAQILMTVAFRRVPAGRATNVFFVAPVLALAWGQVLGDPPLVALDWVGASLVLGSVVALALARGRGPTLGRMA
jgi:drug/metabolite transporter (DMT)-like permease